VIALSLGGLFVRTLNLSIDFEGGAQLAYPFEGTLTAQQVSDVMAEHGRGDAEVQIVNGDTVSIRTETLTRDAEATAGLVDDLAAQAGIDEAEISIQDVGPTWGSEISRKALTGLLVVLAAIAVYISFRFEPKMAIGAMVALLHDVVITAGVYALVGREVTPGTVIAILTILGFSLYDTVVIYDKIKENTESTALVTKHGYAEVVNVSLNQVFMRSVNTSLVVLLPILSLLLFGGETLKDFAFAMFVGVATGAYSSVFIAAPILVLLKNREQRYKQIEARRVARQERVPVRAGVRAPAAARVTGEREGEAAPAEAAPAQTAAAATRATARASGSSRPRPKSKRKPPAKRRRR
jgi:preprotein translocase subunit SecF